MEVPENTVDLLSEYIASKKGTYNELFTEEILNKMKEFKDC